MERPMERSMLHLKRTDKNRNVKIIAKMELFDIAKKPAISNERCCKKTAKPPISKADKVNHTS